LPQQLGEASESRFTQIEPRPPTMRPHLVSAEQWIQAELEADGNTTREPAYPRGARALRVLGQNVILRSDLAGATPQVVRGWSLPATLKRAFDIAGAIVLGIVFAPLMCVIAVMLRKEGGCIVYRHRRVGRDGQHFDCLKFRSMVPNADRTLRELLESRPELKAEWVSGHKLRDDPRVTALGRFLRRTSLDELPQIWNVLRGEMSLVGPRPVVREELMRYGRCLPVYLSAKPGITGLWQVTGRNDTDYRRRVALDVYYVRNQNLLLDLFILLKTTRVVLGGGGAY